MIMNLDKLIAEIFDGSLDPNASYFDVTEEQRDGGSYYEWNEETQEWELKNQT